MKSAETLFFSLLATGFLHLIAVAYGSITSLEKGKFLATLASPRSITASLPSSSPIRESRLNALICVNPTINPAGKIAIQEYANGKWQVIYAPHIKSLGSLLLGEFTVFYKFHGNNQLESNVHYKNLFLGSCWLNTAGIVESVADDKCRIIWNEIWWDTQAFEDGASSPEQKEKHIFPDIIQALGKSGFIEAFSTFPVRYLDEDLCVFEFSLFGTRICAKKLDIAT